jgi:hypothetical protein
MTHRAELVTAAAAIMALVGVAWLAPLMLDQFVLFGDQDQTAGAIASRGMMIWPSLLIVGAAALIGRAGHVREAAVVAAPILAVILAHAAPESAWQLLAYAVAAPISGGAVLAMLAPIRGQLAAPAVLAALLLVGLVAALTTFFLASLAIIGLVAWWLLSRARMAPARLPEPHRR